MGDMNVRIAHTQTEIWDHGLQPFDKDGHIALDPAWDRRSSDETVNAQGLTMLSMMHSMNMLVLNGTRRFEGTGHFTCYTSSKGASTIDYALVAHDALDIMDTFEIGSISPNSDHIPIHVRLLVSMETRSQKKRVPSSSYVMDYKKRSTYTRMLDTLLECRDIPYDIKTGWKIFRNALCEATEITMTKSRGKGHIKGLPHNIWFDDECKEAKKRLKSTNVMSAQWVEATKAYSLMKRKKRRLYETHKEQQDAYMFNKSEESMEKYQRQTYGCDGEFRPRRASNVCGVTLHERKCNQHG
ncbi:hypothetical protein L7F22_009000 [Adiantum nelumboides]|nr:hypothetical protein [Adiantum nelumboides]